MTRPAPQPVTKAEGDRIALAVLILLRAIRDNPTGNRPARRRRHPTSTCRHRQDTATR